MELYQTKSSKLPGTHYLEIYKIAESFYKVIKSKTKRRPYVRSKYFNNEKIFLELFWRHLHEKNLWERQRRLKFFNVAIELLKNSKCEPIMTINLNNKSETLYRFGGITTNREVFVVQLKESKKSGQKWLMSAFPVNKRKSSR